MRKILSLLIAVVLGVSTAFATTVYCKMTYGWWTQDDAAVAVHYWGGESAGTTWPGARMEAVAGDEGAWSYDVPEDITGLMFVRVNGSGDIADWGAKTVNLTLPTDGKNLFTITNETESWGDPGCNGEWSVYGEGGGEEAQMDTIYTWYGKRGESSATEAIEAGGTAAAYGGNSNIVVGTAQKTNWTIKLNKGFSSGTYYVGITLDEALAAGDKLQVAAFRTSGSDAIFGIDFSADEASAATTCQVLFPNNLQTITTNAAPEDTTFTIPECAAGAKFIRIYRNSGSTGVYVANFTILREKGETPEPPVEDPAKFYITGDSALVVDAGMDKAKAWNPDAIKAEADTFVLNLKANQDYLLKLTLDGTWNTAKGYGDLTEQTPGLNDVSNDHNIGFKLAEAGSVQVIYIAGETPIFKLVGNFHVDTPVEPTLANGFYLIGQNGWDVAALSADLLFAANPDTEGEYVLNTTLAEGQEIKVVKVENDAIVAWYPAEGANYTVDAAHAGENKDIYFRETYKEDWAAFGGHIWTGSNEEPVVEKYCEKPSGHQANPEFGDPSGRILLTIAKGEGNNIVVKIKNNNEAGNTHTGLNYLWVNAEGATGGVVRYGDGTHAEADVEEVSVIVPFEETRESYNFINIHWAYSGWEGEWAIDGLTVTAAELCEGAAPVEPTLADGFYLIGQNGWDVAALSADLLFAANPDTEGEYVLNTTLAEGQEIKVVKVENDAIVAWYPAEGANYTVDAAHAGENKDIYFQETYKEDWAAFGGYIWTGENEATAISNTAADAEAVKVLHNGMLLIRKGDKTYNVMGQAVK